MSRVIHFEIHADQPDRAVKFYTDCFDWTFTKWAGEWDYWLIKTGPATEEGIDGGLLKRRGTGPLDGQPVNAFCCTIDVINLDESLTKVLAAGGTLALPKMPIPGSGWLAYAKDTEGNIFGMMQTDPKVGNSS